MSSCPVLKKQLFTLLFLTISDLFLIYKSKILEKSVASQPISDMNNSSIFEKYQSGFRAHHSTETALIKVSNDLLTAADSGTCAIQILLDFSSAFDRVDLYHPLKSHGDIGIKDTACAWFRSYIADRLFSVAIIFFVPSPSHLRWASGFNSLSIAFLTLTLVAIQPNFVLCWLVSPTSNAGCLKTSSS